jgi:hypothetical protein
VSALLLAMELMDADPGRKARWRSAEFRMLLQAKICIALPSLLVHLRRDLNLRVQMARAEMFPQKFS